MWGDPSKQRFGMGGPQEVFGPLDRACHDCQQPFVFPAAAQKHLLEETGAFIDTTATRCLPCSRRKNKLERARRAHAEALAALDLGGPITATQYLCAARAALALLEAGGTTSLDRAIGYCRKARKLGAKAAEAVEDKLAAIRAARPARVGRRSRRSGDRKRAPRR